METNQCRPRTLRTVSPEATRGATSAGCGLEALRLRSVWRLLEETLVRGDVEGTRTYFTRDFELSMPLCPLLPRGPWAWTSAMRFYMRALSEVALEEGPRFSEGDAVALHFTLHARHSGVLGRIPPTGRVLAVSALSFWQFRGGAIERAHLEFDLLRQVDELELMALVTPRSLLAADELRERHP